MTARKSKELKLVQGTERPDRVAPETPRSAPGLNTPRPPSWLDRYGKEKWHQLVPELASRRLLTGDALSLLERLCEAWGEYRRAQAVVRRLGASYESKKGEQAEGDAMFRKRPEVEQAQKAGATYDRLLERLSDRIAAVPPEQQKDPMADLLDRRPRGSRSAAG